LNKLSKELSDELSGELSSELRRGLLRESRSERRVTGYELRVTSCGLRVRASGLGSPSYRLAILKRSFLGLRQRELPLFGTPDRGKRELRSRTPRLGAPIPTL
jgi:hypothetical protein